MKTIKRPESYISLETTARNLEQDGHTNLVAEYQERAGIARQATNHITKVGAEAKRLSRVFTPKPVHGNEPQAEFDSFGAGKELCDWLTNHGWTPPEFIETETV